MDGPKPCTAPTAMGAELQRRAHDNATLHAEVASLAARLAFARSEERRVGKECRL